MATRIAVIVPVLNDVAALSALLGALGGAGIDELVVADGGSIDGSADAAAEYADRLVIGPAGRAVQMNAGAEASDADLLWFVHADSVVDVRHVRALRHALADGAQWGWFDVRLAGARALFRVIAGAMNRRARLTKIATGDQGLFVRRALFDAVGGYPLQPLMEDIELARRLRRRATPHPLRPPITTSSRRWDQGGAWRTILLMWRLRFAYWCGADPERLHARYYGAKG